MAWRAAKSLITLRDQIDAHSPHRDRRSDGLKGDAAHAARKSDHNPDSKGVVHAMDITNDPMHGVDGLALAEVLRARQDPRIDYVISRGQIFYGAAGKHPWVWEPYHGANAHDHHTHISVADSPKLADSTDPWDLSGLGIAGTENPPIPESYPVLSQGAKGQKVAELQGALNAHGASLVVDSDFGERTTAAVEKFQKAEKLFPDGVVGPYTWRALGKS